MRREERRARILACALEVFAQKGYHSSTVADIIKKAAVARGTFYLYFKSKRSVFDELLDDLIAVLNSKVRPIDASRGHAGVVAQMEANVDGFMGYLLDNPAMLRVLLAEAVGLDPGFDKKMNEFYTRFLELLERSLNTGHVMKVVRHLNTKVVSLCILGSVKEVLYQTAMGRNLPNRDVMVREILNYNIRGLMLPEVAGMLNYSNKKTKKT